MRIFVLILILSYSLQNNAQVLPGTPVSGFPSGTTSEIQSIPNPIQGTLVFSSDEKIFYYYNATQWVPLNSPSSNVYVGAFTITPPGGSSSTSFTTQVSNIPFQPSQITFSAYANIEQFGINNDNQTNNNDQSIANSFGSMRGFARLNPNSSITQNVIYVGGSGNSINDISRYSSNNQCIGIRYGNQNGDSLGIISGVLNSFTYNATNSTGGFSLTISYTLGTSGNPNRNDDVLNEGLVVLYTAYR